jgi:hypothetical protein
MLQIKIINVIKILTLCANLLIYDAVCIPLFKLYKVSYSIADYFSVLRVLSEWQILIK